MKKVFITGNTSGIGLALHELMDGAGYQVTGGSRRTGWDLADPEHYSQVYDCDILVNNAYHVEGQINLLRDVYKKWQYQEKTIINVGSAMKDVVQGRPMARMNYNMTKKALEVFSFWIADNDRYCRSMMYNPGFVDTPLARKGFPDWSEQDQKKALSRAMDVQECARTILFMIEGKHLVREITHM